jgi:hypothetical protein
MGKQYQTRDATASTPELAIPEEVSVALAEIATRPARACWRCRSALGCR